MEKYFNKTRILIWIIIALVILNISTLASIFWHKYQFKHHWDNQKEMNMNEGSRMGKHLFEKLHLTDLQKEKFHQTHLQFKEMDKVVIDKMFSYRQKMLNELKKPETDTLILNQYSREIGDLHVQLKMNTIKLYTELKSICTPEQQDSLAIIFTDILQSESGLPMHPPKEKHHQD